MDPRSRVGSIDFVQQPHCVNNNPGEAGATFDSVQILVENEDSNSNDAEHNTSDARIDPSSIATDVALLTTEHDHDDNRSQCSSIRSFGSLEDLLDAEMYDVALEPDHFDETILEGQSEDDLNDHDDLNNDTIVEPNNSASDDLIPTQPPEETTQISETVVPTEINPTPCTEDVENNTEPVSPVINVVGFVGEAVFKEVMVEAVPVETPEEPLGVSSIMMLGRDVLVTTSNGGTLLLLLVSDIDGSIMTTVEDGQEVPMTRPFPTWPTYYRGNNDTDINNVSQ